MVCNELKKIELISSLSLKTAKNRIVKIAKRILGRNFFDYLNHNDKEKYLNKFEEDTFLSIKENFSENPVLHAFQLTVNKFNIDKK